MKNKKIYGVLLIIVLLVSKVFAVDYNTTIANSKVELAKIAFKDEIEKEVEEKTYFEFIKETIPAKFVKPFYDFTHKNKKLGIEMLGTAKHESGWKVFEGPINSNGTRDYGPLMLNSANLENEKFMNSFSENCKQYKYDRDIYYMCICINFYKSIRTQYGPWSALQIYNGGWRTMRKNCSKDLKRQVLGYANKVYRHINQYESDYKEFISNHHDEFVEYVAFQYYNRKVQQFVSKLAMSKTTIADAIFGLNKQYVLFKLIDRTCLFDEEIYELYVLGHYIPQNIVLASPDDIYLDDNEEFFEKLLC